MTVPLFCLLCFASEIQFPVTALKPALVRAKQENRLILAEFWTFMAEPSRSYAKRTLSSKPVMAWLSQHAVGARVNVDFNKKLKEQFFVKEVPTLLLLDTHLVPWARLVGPMEPEQIARELTQALKEKKAFEEAQKRLKENPRDIDALRARFRGFLRQEKGPQAEAVVAKLRQVDPNATKVRPEELLFAVAEKIYESHAQRPAAIRCLREAAQLARGKNPLVRRKALFHLGTLTLAEKEFEKTAQLLELLLEEFSSFPERSKAMYVLGLTYVRHLKQLEKGKKILRQVRERYADRFALAAENLLTFLRKQEQGFQE